MLGKIKDRRRRGKQRVRWLDRITDSMDMSLSKSLGDEEGQEARHVAIHGVTKSQIQLSYWTATRPIEQNNYSWGWYSYHIFIIFCYGLPISTNMKVLLMTCLHPLSPKHSTFHTHTHTGTHTTSFKVIYHRLL